MSQQIKAVFADEGTLKKYNCWRTESSTIETLHHESGWSFESFHSTIPNEAGMQALIKELKSSLRSQFPSLASQNDKEGCSGDRDDFQINSFRLHIPPMVFEKDVMCLRIKNNSISFKAADALSLWASQVTFLRCLII